MSESVNDIANGLVKVHGVQILSCEFADNREIKIRFTYGKTWDELAVLVQRMSSGLSRFTFSRFDLVIEWEEQAAQLVIKRDQMDTFAIAMRSMAAKVA